MSVLRGDVYWVDPGGALGTEQAGRRPYLVLSQRSFNDRLGAVVGIALTSREPKWPFPLSVPVGEGRLPRRSWAKVGQVRTISVLRLGDRLGRVAPADVDRTLEALLEIIGP
ncbi:MAG: type II toxin-antitoxin system PemK/MazF family toxin [Planctomycetaceae bacterium]|nr:type II toxin-antitoxin system PemK/MazF family toxin [Planctomycetota bacterium]NUN51573.1 type II toxin-antitoxin system PemK/MazF family toxin [Planctomycetaceae bacterium]